MDWEWSWWGRWNILWKDSQKRLPTLFECPDWNGRVWVQSVCGSRMSWPVLTARRKQSGQVSCRTREIVWCWNKWKPALTLCFLFWFLTFLCHWTPSISGPLSRSILITYASVVTHADQPNPRAGRGRRKLEEFHLQRTCLRDVTNFGNSRSQVPTTSLPQTQAGPVTSGAWTTHQPCVLKPTSPPSPLPIL